MAELWRKRDVAVAVGKRAFSFVRFSQSARLTKLFVITFSA